MHQKLAYGATSGNSQNPHDQVSFTDHLHKAESLEVITADRFAYEKLIHFVETRNQQETSPPKPRLDHHQHFPEDSLVGPLFTWLKETAAMNLEDKYDLAVEIGSGDGRLILQCDRAFQNKFRKYLLVESIIRCLEYGANRLYDQTSAQIYTTRSSTFGGTLKMVSGVTLIIMNPTWDSKNDNIIYSFVSYASQMLNLGPANAVLLMSCPSGKAQEFRQHFQQQNWLTSERNYQMLAGSKKCNDQKSADSIWFIVQKQNANQHKEMKVEYQMQELDKIAVKVPRSQQQLVASSLCSNLSSATILDLPLRDTEQVPQQSLINTSSAQQVNVIQTKQVTINYKMAPGNTLALNTDELLSCAPTASMKGVNHKERIKRKKRKPNLDEESKNSSGSGSKKSSTESGSDNYSECQDPNQDPDQDKFGSALKYNESKPWAGLNIHQLREIQDVQEKISLCKLDLTCAIQLIKWFSRLDKRAQLCNAQMLKEFLKKLGSSISLTSFKQVIHELCKLLPKDIILLILDEKERSKEYDWTDNQIPPKSSSDDSDQDANALIATQAQQSEETIQEQLANSRTRDLELEKINKKQQRKIAQLQNQQAKPQMEEVRNQTSVISDYVKKVTLSHKKIPALQLQSESDSEQSLPDLVSWAIDNQEKMKKVIDDLYNFSQNHKIICADLLKKSLETVMQSRHEVEIKQYQEIQSNYVQQFTEMKKLCDDKETSLKLFISQQNDKITAQIKQLESAKLRNANQLSETHSVEEQLNEKAKEVVLLKKQLITQSEDHQESESKNARAIALQKESLGMMTTMCDETKQRLQEKQTQESKQQARILKLENKLKDLKVEIQTQLDKNQRCANEIQSLKTDLQISQSNLKSEKLMLTTLEEKFGQIKRDYNASLDKHTSQQKQIDDGLQTFKIYKTQAEDALSSMRLNIDKLSLSIGTHGENNQANLRKYFDQLTTQSQEITTMLVDKFGNIEKTVTKKWKSVKQEINNYSPPRKEKSQQREYESQIDMREHLSQKFKSEEKNNYQKELLFQAREEIIALKQQVKQAKDKKKEFKKLAANFRQEKKSTDDFEKKTQDQITHWLDKIERKKSEKSHFILQASDEIKKSVKEFKSQLHSFEISRQADQRNQLSETDELTLAKVKHWSAMEGITITKFLEYLSNLYLQTTLTGLSNNHVTNGNQIISLTQNLDQIRQQNDQLRQMMFDLSNKRSGNTTNYYNSHNTSTNTSVNKNDNSVVNKNNHQTFKDCWNKEVRTENVNQLYEQIQQDVIRTLASQNLAQDEVNTIGLLRLMHSDYQNLDGIHKWFQKMAAQVYSNQNNLKPLVNPNLISVKQLVVTEPEQDNAVDQYRDVEDSVLWRIFNNAQDILNFLTKPTREKVALLSQQLEIHPDVLYSLAASHVAEMKKYMLDKSNFVPDLPRYTTWLLMACSGMLVFDVWKRLVKNALATGFVETFKNEGLHVGKLVINQQGVQVSVAPLDERGEIASEVIPLQLPAEGSFQTFKAFEISEEQEAQEDQERAHQQLMLVHQDFLQIDTNQQFSNQLLDYQKLDQEMQELSSGNKAKLTSLTARKNLRDQKNKQLHPRAIYERCRQGLR